MKPSATNSAEPNRWAVLARVIRPQGLRGEVLAEVLTTFPEKFAERRRLFLLRDANDATGREVHLDEHRFPPGRNAGRIVLKFAGVDSIEAAESLAGMEVAVPWDERATPEEDEYFLGDLVGCAVFDGEREVGVVEDVDTASTSAPLLVVRAANGEEHMLPLAKAFLKEVNTQEKRIRMALPEGLLAINRREKAE